MELVIKRTNAEDLPIPLEPGRPLYVVGPNGSGKSAMIQHAIMQLGAANVRRVSAHRQTYMESAAIDMTPLTRKRFDEQLSGQEPNPVYRWREYNSEARLSSVLFDLTAKENALARRLMNHAYAEDMVAISSVISSERPVFGRINDLLAGAGLSVTVENSEGEEILARHKSRVGTYSMAQMSDGERNAVILAANVLTVSQGIVLLIDEPERHLHRSIIEPLLSALFAERPDCPFVISTHEVGLPLANPEAPVLVVRSCSWNGDRAEAWDAKLLEVGADLPEDVKRAILGSRRKILFVEGEPQSLDARIYSVLFPDISVFPVGDYNGVIDAVTGLRNSIELHEVEAFGLIDADNRCNDEIVNLLQKGIYALTGYSVESIYYSPEAIEALAMQQAMILGMDADNLMEAVKTGALASLRNPGVPERMAARRCERVVRQKAQIQMPNWETIQDDTIQPIYVDAKQLFDEELKRFNNLLKEGDLWGIIARYPVRHTGAIAGIEKNLEISKKKYPGTLISKIRRDSELADKLRNRIEPLASVLALASVIGAPK